MKGKQIYWEDVEVGQEVPGYSMELTLTQFIKQVSGTQDWNPSHHDTVFSRSKGRPDAFLCTAFSQAMCSHVMTNWIGEEGFLTKFHMEMRRMNLMGDILTFKGKVTNKYVKDGKHYVEADVWAENPRDGVSTPCQATAILPSRG